MGGAIPDTPDSKRVQRWAPNASNVGEETTLQMSVEQKHKVNQDPKCTVLKSIL